MITHNIVFPYDDEQTVKDKINYLMTTVGPENVAFEDRCDIKNLGNIRWITIRCEKELWCEIMFQLNLEPVYA